MLNESLSIQYGKMIKALMLEEKKSIRLRTSYEDRLCRQHNPY